MFTALVAPVTRVKSTDVEDPIWPRTVESGGLPLLDRAWKIRNELAVLTAGLRVAETVPLPLLVSVPVRTELMQACGVPAVQVPA
jgi:hypothetical protein